MDFGGDLSFEGKNCVSWIKVQEEKEIIEIVFDNDGSDVSLEFEPKSFKAVADMIQEFQRTGKTGKIPSSSCGRVRPDFFVILAGEKIKFQTDIGREYGDNPVLTMSCPKSKVEIVFNRDQAREMRRRLDQIIALADRVDEIDKENPSEDSL